MKQIKCTSGAIALVDDEDYEKVKDLNWNDYTGYALTFRRRKNEDSKLKSTSMHRLIMNFPNSNVDHINGNTLDNRKCNLRIATNIQNGQNRKMSKNNTVGYKGVTYHKRDKKYQVQIIVNTKRIYLGYFNTAEEAAKAYNKAAKKYFGEFAKLNKIVAIS